jgi:uncharacterized protein (DUF302 family)
MKTYSLNIELKGLAFPEALERTRKALAAQGFGIPVEMDTQALFKQKLGKESPSRMILGACLASVAFEALNQEPDIAVLLPCNVVVREIKGGSEVSAVSPKSLFSLVKNVDPALAEIVEAKLKLVLQELGEQS